MNGNGQMNVQSLHCICIFFYCFLTKLDVTVSHYAHFQVFIFLLDSITSCNHDSKTTSDELHSPNIDPLPPSAPLAPADHNHLNNAALSPLGPAMALSHPHNNLGIGFNKYTSLKATGEWHSRRSGNQTAFSKR